MQSSCPEWLTGMLSRVMTAVSRDQVSRVDHLRAFATARDGFREIETLESTIERASAQAEHLGRGLLVAVRPHQRALNVVALDVASRSFFRDIRGRRRLRVPAAGYAGAGGMLTASSRSEMRSLSTRMQARSITLRSSRMFPSQ